MRLVIVLLAGGVVALGVSCSNGSADSKSTGEEPESWTHAWCVALRDFQNDNLARAADLRRRLASSSSAAEARAEVVDFYADGAARIDRFLADVKLGDWDEEHPTSAVQTAYRKDAECRRLRAVK